MRVLMLVACLLGLIPSLAGTTVTQDASVRVAQQARFAAMIRRDQTALDSLLAPSLSYTHTTGQREGKASFLETVASGRVRYVTIEPDSVEVQLFGATALAVGRARVRVVAGGTPMAFAIRFSEAYVQRGDRWALVLWQSTRLPDQ